MSDENRLMIHEAFRAVQHHVLPGLGVAWDESNPAVILITECLAAQLWVESGRDIEEIVLAIRLAVTPFSPPMPKPA